MSADGRPQILVSVDEEAEAGRWSEYAAPYARAIEDAGGLPVPFFYGRPLASAPTLQHDGLVTIGGVDVDPGFYGAQPHVRLGPTVPARDVAELALTRLALGSQLPLLAICRGAQLLNVACGGSLQQHIESPTPHRGPDDGSDASGWHGVDVAPGTLLSRITGAGPLWVNSRHHQAVTPTRLASGLVEAGRTGQGELAILEAIEAPDHPFALGLQWHPERLEMSADADLEAASGGLFRAFVASCIEHRARASHGR